MAEITFLAQFPPPYHGLSNAVDVLYRSRLAQKYRFHRIDLAEKRVVPKTLARLLSSKSDLYYLTISQSVGGNLRDLVILANLREIAQANRKRVKEHFSQDQYLGALEKIFDEVLAEGRPGS